METFTLSRKELHRPGLLKAALGGRITNRQVATALRVTIRHVRRLKRRFEAGGATALGHRSRGRPAPRRLRAAVRAEVSRLMTTLYVGFNDTHLTEKLREVHGLTLARESWRRRRCGLGRPAQRARRPPARSAPPHSGGRARGARADRWQPLRVARGPGARAHAARGRRSLLARLHRRLQPALWQAARRPGRRLATPVPRPGAHPQLPLPARRRA